MLIVRHISRRRIAVPYIRAAASAVSGSHSIQHAATNVKEVASTGGGGGSGRQVSQSVVPPYILESIAASKDLPLEAREAAKNTLAMTNELLAARIKHAESLWGKAKTPASTPPSTQNPLSPPKT